MFDVFHVNRSNDKKDARAHRSAIDLFEKRVFVGKCNVQDLLLCLRYQEKCVKPKIHQKREGLKRDRGLCPPEPDVNKLTTSKETKISFSDIVKFLM